MTLLLRTVASRLALIMRVRWPLIISTLLIAQTLLTFFWPAGAIVTGLLALLSLLMFVREALVAAEESRSLHVEPDGLDLSDLDVSGLQHGSLIQVAGQTYWSAPEVDKALREFPVRLEHSRIPHRLPNWLEQLVPVVVAHRRAGGSVLFNGRVLRLDTDLLPLPSQSARTRPVRYFDALATNYLCGYQVVSRRFPDPVARGRDLMIDSNRRLRVLGQSWAANSIGVSTIAFTADDELLLVQQSPGNVSEGDRLAPSGSGSAEPKDIDSPPTTLQAVLINAMERELREECNLGAIALSTKLLGFSRWLDHGAKPEFYGVTRIGATERELLDRGIARRERSLVSRVRTVRIDFPSLVAASTAGDLSAIQRSITGLSSTPLLMCLLALGRRIDEEPDFMPSMGR